MWLRGGLFNFIFFYLEKLHINCCGNICPSSVYPMVQEIWYVRQSIYLAKFWTIFKKNYYNLQI